MTRLTAVSNPVEVSGWPYRFALVSTGEMFPDLSYQRPAKPFRTEWNPLLVQTLVLSLRRTTRAKKRYAIIDGQRRWTLAQQAGVSPLPSVVYENMTVEEEAWLFANLQLNRLRIDPFHRHRAESRAGDRESLEIDALMAEVGWEFAPSSQDGKIAAVTTVEKMYRRNADGCRRALTLLKAIWPTEPMPGNLIGGLATFIGDEDPDDERLAERMRFVDPMAVLRMASALRGGRGHGGGSFGYTAKAFAEIYRRRTRVSI